MKDYLKQLVADKPNKTLQKRVTMEYLQARILQSLQENGAFLNWAFLGGTALRFLYSIPRYSEDLDFSLLDTSKENGFKLMLKKIKNMFQAENYALNIKISDRKTVASAFVRFEGLMYELGISPHPSEVLSIKLEIDTNPPAGASVATTITRRYVTLNLLHYDKPSLLAGKLHALLSRQHLKGRDLYDLAWYLADRSWPPPNLRLLNAALAQTNWKGPLITSANWRDILITRLATINWIHAAEDVRPFLERENDISLVTKENCMKLLQT